MQAKASKDFLCFFVHIFFYDFTHCFNKDIESLIILWKILFDLFFLSG